MVGLQTSHRYGNASMLKSDVVLGIGNRWANRHTGSVEVYTEGRKFIHVDIEPTQIGRVFTPDLGIVSDAGSALTMFIEVAREWKAAGKLKDRSAWLNDCQQRKATHTAASMELVGDISLGLIMPTCGTYNAPAKPHITALNTHTNSLKPRGS